MAETLPGNSFILKQSTNFVRVFFFGTTGQAANMVYQISKNGGGLANAANGAAGGCTEIGQGWYSIQLTVTDTNTLGILASHVTANSGGPADYSDIIRSTIFSDLLLTGTGRAIISDNITQNQPLNGFTFLMVNASNGLPATGLTVTAQRSLGGAGFASCANPVTELSNGIYSINLAATDTNGNTVTLHFTATNAADTNIFLITTP